VDDQACVDLVNFPLFGNSSAATVAGGHAAIAARVGCFPQFVLSTIKQQVNIEIYPCFKQHLMSRC
jgi:hypothetical protein